VQLGFFFDQSRCSECLTCVIACKDWNDIPAGPVSWIEITSRETGQFPNISVSFMATLCYHCAEAPCIQACPSTAIVKNKENGIVTVDGEICLGIQNCGGICRDICPYSAPQFGTEVNAKMQKCDMCDERWIEGLKPICVEACPMRALDAGPFDELESKYGNTKEVTGFTYNKASQPSIIFKAK
jgi:anaerobic dimethyl sulfoxide reductase subunit B (iron-sulfur subunit)